MPKHVKKVAAVMRRAKDNGSGKNWPYEAEYDKDSRRMKLWHYGTLIFQSQGSELEALGGYSASDRDAISTAMDVMGVPGTVSNAQKKPSWAKKQVHGWWVG